MELSDFAGILDEFVAAQRRAALGEARKQKITISRRIEGFCDVHYETVIDEGTSSTEIFHLLAPIDAAIDRLKAKEELRLHYNTALNGCAKVDQQRKKLDSEREGYEKENAARSENRRQRVVMTSQQMAGLKGIREGMNVLFAEIDDILQAADEERRVLTGADPLELLREKVMQRLDALRGNRDEAA